MLTPRKETKMNAWSFVVHRIKAMELKCLLRSWKRRTFESELSHFNKSFINILQSMYVQQWECAYCIKYWPYFLVTPSHLQLQAFLTHNTCRSLKNSTLHICNLNPHTCSLKHLSFIDEVVTLSRHMRDENPTIKAHGREIEKHRVKFGEVPKSTHFRISPCIFFLCFRLTWAFWLCLKFWPNSSWKPWVLVTLWITLLWHWGVPSLCFLLKS